MICFKKKWQGCHKSALQHKYFKVRAKFCGNPIDRTSQQAQDYPFSKSREKRRLCSIFPKPKKNYTEQTLHSYKHQSEYLCQLFSIQKVHFLLIPVLWDRWHQSQQLCFNCHLIRVLWKLTKSGFIVDIIICKK